MPQDFLVPAMKFTGPAGDGRRGSAGFVVQAKELIQGDGTRLSFVFQRDASGYCFQVIHPLKAGHVLVSVDSGLTIHRGGSWGDIGWGNPNSSDKFELNADAVKVLPLQPDVEYKVISELSAAGTYRLWIDGKLLCRHTISTAEPLVLEVPPSNTVWGGSSWARTSFAGEDFCPKLHPGNVGLILGPMDASGPKQSFQQITLMSALPDDARLTSSQAVAADALNVAAHFEPLWKLIDNAREAGELTKSKCSGGQGGGPFAEIPVEPSLLMGFEYTTTTFYGGHLTVKSLRPIFRNRGGETLGQMHGVPHSEARTILAEEGYVVAGIVAKSGHRVDGMRLIFMRVKNGRLNPDDTYRSEWFGGHGGGAERLYAANGDPIVGIFGRQGDDLDAIGFIQLRQD